MRALPYDRARIFLLKSLAEFRARRRESHEIVFSEDMCLGKNTLRKASVELAAMRPTEAQSEAKLPPPNGKAIWGN